MNGAGAQNDAFAGGDVYFLSSPKERLDAGCAPAVEGDASDGNAGHDGEVRPFGGGAEIAARRADAPAPARRQLKISGAVLGRAVEVRAARRAKPRRGLDRGVHELVSGGNARHGNGAEAPMQLLFAAAIVGFELREVGQHIRIAPTGVSEVAPAVIVLPLPSNGDQSVDGAAAAQELPSRPIDGAIVELGFRLGVETPVQPAIPTWFCRSRWADESMGRRLWGQPRGERHGIRFR